MEHYTKKKVTTFQERFTQLFNESNKTMMELGKELHISYQTISAWKTGVRSPKEPTAFAIASYFNVNVLWLMGFDVPRDASLLSQQDHEQGLGIPKTTEARIISGGIDRMPPDRREQALKILQIAFAEYADYFKEDNEDDT